LKAVEQLQEYGFRVTPELERVLKKLPADVFNQIEMREHQATRIAKIWCDDKNKTDIVITQKI